MWIPPTGEIFQSLETVTLSGQTTSLHPKTTGRSAHRRYPGRTEQPDSTSSTARASWLEAQRREQRTRLTTWRCSKEGCGYCNGVENFARHLAAAKRELRRECLDRTTFPDDWHAGGGRKPRHLFPVCTPMLQRRPGPQEGADRPRGSGCPAPADNRPLKGRGILGKKPTRRSSSRPTPGHLGGWSRVLARWPSSDPSTGGARSVDGGASQCGARSTTLSGKAFRFGPSARKRCDHHPHQAGMAEDSHELPGRNGVRVRYFCTRRSTRSEAD